MNGDKTFCIDSSALSVATDKKPDITIYPTPVSDILNLSEKADKIEVTDQSGRLLKMQKNCNSINVENLEWGMYYLKITNRQKTKLKKFIKK